MKFPSFLALLALVGAAHAQFTPAGKPAPLRKLANSARTTFGYITVPENRADPANSRTIRLAVIISPARSATPLADPVFYLVGGPGGSATLSSGGSDIFDALNDTRDIVYLDPRGAGFSEPNLFMRRDGRTVGQFTRRNRDYFANQLGADVSAYNSTQIAADYESARLALGYSQINLFASSYGTFVAQEMLRRYPSSLRAVVMSGNSPATDPFIPTSLQIQRQGIEALFRDVQRTRPARRAFPRLKSRFYALVRRLDRSPVKLRLKNTDTGKLESVTIDGSEFLGTVSELLQTTRTIRYLPLLVTQLERREYGSLVARFFAPYDELRRENPFGMYLSVLGTDFAAPGYLRATERGILATRNPTLISALGGEYYQLAQLIVAWNVPYRPGSTRTLPMSSVPTLLVNGRMDAQTPANGGAIIARGLSNATNYVYPRIGHGVGFVAGPDMRAAAAFIRNPSARPAYSTAGLTGRNFYARSYRASRARELDDWRRGLPAPAPRPPF